MYSIAVGPRFFRWKMLSLSGPNAVLFLQLLIAFVTMSAGESLRHLHWFPLDLPCYLSGSLEEECLPIFEVLNCLLNLAASCLDDENEIPLKGDSFVLCRASIPLIVLHSLVIYGLWSMFSTKSLHFFRLCSQMRFMMSIFSLDGSGEMWFLLRRSSRLVITSSISAGTGSS